MNDEDLLVMQDAALEGRIVLSAPGCKFAVKRKYWVLRRPLSSQDSSRLIAPKKNRKEVIGRK